MKRLLSLSILATIILSACGPSTYHTENQSPLVDEVLEESLDLGTEFLIHNQTSEGNFNYEYDFLEGTLSEDDNAVRQAGALWGLTLINKYSPSTELEDAILHGLDFFADNTHEYEGKHFLVYPNATGGKTGAVALVSLALMDFLSTADNIPDEEKYELMLEQYLEHLISLRREVGLFNGTYNVDTGEAYISNSPYADGEALLAMTRAAKHYGYGEWKDEILDSADYMYKKHVEEALEEDPDSDTTKGFFQWGIMSFYEIYDSSWGEKKYAEWSIDLAHWMIDVHRTLDRTRNTAYAYEGIIHAYELARLTKDRDAMDKFREVIDEGLYKLITWQVGHFIQNEYLSRHFTEDPLAVGGVLNASDEPFLRVDVTQHQMHAVVLALRFLQ